MQIVKTIKEIRNEIKRAKSSGKSIGYVPTMGFLHDGHISLIKRAHKENDFVVVSIFVNPTQFGPSEDYESYPRDLNRDANLAEKAGADIIFAPSVKEMYPDGFSTYVKVYGNISKKLCGQSREGHFKGVTTVVSKLFNIVTPDRAYFGQKDAQQLAIIKKMVKELNYDIEIVPCSIVREKNGLAMSSRNTYLNTEERKAALILSKSLFKAKEMIENGENNPEKVRNFIIENIKTEKLTEIDYVEIVNADTLDNIDKIKGKVLIALAVKIGQARLIDNIQMEV
ncbi:pantoate--beta-alanine ligase [Thermohalobacter berrensis]|uniref:Pantothenate synthetase n=1 Tax=Thermohalobacter berrensis TaxID=99594 RepID=A0A419T6W7_9FIRM|nr:pantoate--beta-alanine ligase [Thermohalobacter berrensis]RKD33175.1 pantoate--beta-alanine ligase [Thermohalobacter berrensis]